MDRIAALLGRIGALRDEQLEGIERNGYVPSENLKKLLVALRERRKLRTLDIDRTDDGLVQEDRDGQRTACPFEGLQIHRIARGVFA